MQLKCRKCREQFETTTDMRQVGFCPACDEPLAGALSGLMVDDYQVVALLGQGANGVVFLAWQLKLFREVAIKLLAADKVSDSGAILSFFSEAQAVARLMHPNIVQAIGAGVTGDGVYYFAMELIKGYSVEKLIDDYGAMDYSQALAIAVKVADALAYSWNKYELIHGDIKPANIMLTDSGEPKLADLGLAAFGKVRIVADEIMATPLYAPPEIIRGDAELIGFKSDMYSFGATLYEMFCGDPPFYDTEPERVLQMHLNDDLEPLEQRMGFFNQRLSAFVSRLLSKDPRQRPSSWNVVRDFLLSCIAEQE